MSARSRRRFLRASLGMAGFGLISGCAIAPKFGWQRSKVPVIGFLATGPREGRAPLVAAFLQGLQDLGYVEGQTIVLEYRFADANEDLPALAADLVARNVDVVLASATPASIAARSATTTIPIVMGGTGDPVATGLVASLARPGGNVTGMSLLIPQVSGKRLELLKEVVPGLTRLAVISNETNPLHVSNNMEIEAATRALGLRMHLLSVRGVDDFEGAFQDATSVRADAIYGASDPHVTNARAQLAALALRHRLPSMFDYRENVDAGGLMAYGPALTTVYRRAAAYVVKILEGANPAEMPVEQPTSFELFINATTARALGLTIPQAILQQATEIVQ